MWRIDIATPFDRYTIGTDGFATLRLGPVESITFTVADLRVVTFTHRDVDAVTIILDCGLQMSFTGVGSGNAQALHTALLTAWAAKPKATLLPAGDEP